MKDFIPVEAKINDKHYIWYMDVSTLGLNELVNLRNELIGTRADSIVILDAIIHDTININCQDLKAERRENHRSNGQFKRHNALIRHKRKERR